MALTSFTLKSVPSRTTGKWLITAGAIALVAGCATLDKSECETGDWRSIGMQDGTLGKESGTRLAAHSKACGKHGVRLDSDEYLGGYAEGLESYCTADMGFQAGTDFGKNTFSTKAYKGVCPDDLEITYLEGYLAGLKMNLDVLYKELTEEEAELDNQRSAYVLLKLLNSSRADNAEENMEEADEAVDDMQSTVSSIIKEVEKWLSVHPELREQMN